MIITYHRTGRLSLLGTAAAVAVGTVVLGVAAVTLLAVGVAAVGTRLLRGDRAIGPAAPGRTDPNTIEGVVVDSSDPTA